MNPLVCLRQGDKPPPVPSRHGACMLCSAPVWVALSSPPLPDIWCWECAGAQITASDKQGKPVTVARPTPAQLTDLAKHWNKRS